MMENLLGAFRHLARRYHSRWSQLDDVLARIRSFDDGGRSKEGEKARRILVNAFGNQTYPESIKDALVVDRRNALRKLAKPLNEALSHIVTIEMTEKLLSEIETAERARSADLAETEAVQRGPYGDLLDALHAYEVPRGAYSALSKTEVRAIARYIRSKVEKRRSTLPAPRTDAETRATGKRRHPFWNPYTINDRKSPEAAD